MLNVSQPSLSAQIAEAEQQLGAVLVERGRHGAIMTPLGEDRITSYNVCYTKLLRKVDNINRFFAQFGPVSEYSVPNCTMNTTANTDAAKSGTFATCVLQIQAEHSPGTVTVTWVREDETWKLGGFYVNFHDNSVLMDKAEKLDALA